MRNNFLKCGVAGWCMEVLWTSVTNVKSTDKRLIGNTSLWMFPIYGMAAVIAPVSKFFQRKKCNHKGEYLYFFYLFRRIYNREYSEKEKLLPVGLQ